MHIPDHYLSPQTCAVFTAVMLPIWAVSAAKMRKEMDAKKVPLIGIMAAFTFLIMMFNIPLPGGTSGHAVGSALSAILIGPFATVIAVSTALLIQALLFGDGGILAFGANCFNMAFAMPFAAYGIYELLKRILPEKISTGVSGFLAGYFAIAFSALLAAVEFGIQPLLFKDAGGMPLYCPYPLWVSIPAMVLPHLLVAGFVEGFVTAGVLSFLKRVSPDMVPDLQGRKAAPVYMILAILAAVSPVGLIAAGTAWGEWGKDEIQKLFGSVPQGMAKGFEFSSPFPDYSIPGMPEIAGYILSAVVGIAILLIAFRLAGLALRKKTSR